MAIPRRLSSINLNLLVALDALLNQRSVTHAAAKCGVSQSAMSQSLAQLRTLLNDPVLVRSGRRMVLTPRAEAMGSALTAALGDLDSALLGQVNFEPHTLDRRLVIASGPALAWLIAVPLYERLRRDAPNVEIVFDSNADYARRLESGTVDFVVDLSLGATSGVRSQELYTDSMAPVLRRGHPLAPPPGEPLTYEVWASIPHVILATPQEIENPMDVFLASKGLTRTIAMRLPSMNACAMACSETDLCWNTAASSIQQFQSRYAVVPHSLPHLPGFGPAFMFWHARWDADPGHAFLRCALYETLMAMGDTTDR